MDPTEAFDINWKLRIANENLDTDYQISYQFAQYAYQCVKEYDLTFQNEIRTAADMIDRLPDLFFDKINGGINLGLQLIQKFAPWSYVVDESFYREQMACYSFDLFPFINTFKDQLLFSYANIKANYGDIQAKNLLEDNGSRWIGGGSGLSGALTGAATAGILNLGSSLLRGAVNSTYRSSLSKELADELNYLYLDQDLRHHLRISYYTSICNIAFGALNACASRKYSEDVDYIKYTQNQMLGFDSILNNLDQNALCDPEKKKYIEETVFEKLIRYPSHFLFFYKLIHCWAANDNMMSLARYAGHESMFLDEWKALVHDALVNIENADRSSISAVEKRIEEVQITLYSTPFRANRLLKELADEKAKLMAFEASKATSVSFLEQYRAIQNSPYSVEARNFWANSHPLAEFFTLYHFKSSYSGQNRELVQYLINNGVSVAYAIAAMWEMQKDKNSRELRKVKKWLTASKAVDDPACMFLRGMFLREDTKGYFNRMDKEGDEKKLLITAADNGYPDAIHYLVRDYESTSGDSVGKAIDAVGSIFSFGLFSGVTNYIINQAQYEKYQTMLKNFGIPEGYYTPLRSV